MNENPQYIRQTIIVSYREEGGWVDVFLYKKIFCQISGQKVSFCSNIPPLTLYDHCKF